MISIFRRCVARNLGSLPWRSRSQHDLAANSSPAHNFVIWNLILKLLHRNDHHIEAMCRAQIRVTTLKVKVKHDLAAKSCPAHNFVIWRRILKLFHRNDHHIKTMFRAQHLGRYLEDQGHSMTLKQNGVKPITSLFKVGF